MKIDLYQPTTQTKHIPHLIKNLVRTHTHTNIQMRPGCKWKLRKAISWRCHGHKVYFIWMLLFLPLKRRTIRSSVLGEGCSLLMKKIPPSNSNFPYLANWLTDVFEQEQEVSNTVPSQFAHLSQRRVLDKVSLGARRTREYSMRFRPTHILFFRAWFSRCQNRKFLGSHFTPLLLWSGIIF